MCRSLTLYSELFKSLHFLSLYLTFVHSLTFTVTLFPKGELYLSLSLSPSISFSLSLYVTSSICLRHPFSILNKRLKNVIPIYLLNPAHRIWARLVFHLPLFCILRKCHWSLQPRVSYRLSPSRPRPFPNVSHMTDPSGIGRLYHVGSGLDSNIVSQASLGSSKVRTVSRRYFTLL